MSYTYNGRNAPEATRNVAGVTAAPTGWPVVGGGLGGLPVRRVDLGGLIASLFGAGEQGVLFLPGPDTCYTDEAGMTPAAAGDTVARMDDLSGRGNHVTQASAGARPALRQTPGGLWYLEFDAVDDFMTVNIDLTLTAPVQIFVAGAIFTNTTNAGFNRLGISGTGSQRCVGIENLTQLKVDARSRATYLHTDMTALSVFEGRFLAAGAPSSNECVAAAVNGGDYALHSISSLSGIESNLLDIGRGIVAGHANQHQYGFCLTGYHLSASQRSSLVSYLAVRAGAAL